MLLTPSEGLAQPADRNRHYWHGFLGYLRLGDVWSSRSTSGFAAAGTGLSLVMIDFALIDSPYIFLFASLSESIEAPSNDTPANIPLLREYVSTSAVISEEL